MHRIIYRGMAFARRSVRNTLFARTAKMRNRRAIVSFTFDDFPQSAVSNGARLLEAHGARGTFYVTGTYCGQVAYDVPQYRAEDLLAVATAGHELGCHTFTHPRVSMLSATALNREIELNADFITRHLPGSGFRTFAYPFGDISFAATQRLQSKFAACRCSEQGLNIGTADLGRLRSIRLFDRTISPDEVSKVIGQAATRTAWLIFYTHDVSKAPSPYGCTPTLFEHAVTAAISAGAEILPVDAALKAIAGAH